MGEIFDSAQDSFDPLSKIAQTAATQAQYYDSYVYRNIQDREIRDQMRRQASSDRKRNDFSLEMPDLGKFQQRSTDSSDSLAIFFSDPLRLWIFAFRGTDGSDPMRMLDVLPPDQLARIHQVAPDFDRLPYEVPGACGCSEKCPDLPRSKNQVLSEVTGQQCKLPAFQVDTSSLSREPTQNALSDSHWNVRGGKYVAATDSDCNADKTIGVDTLYTIAPLVTANLNRDAKHAQSWLHAKDLLQRIVKKNPTVNQMPTVLFTGHSLGGSLAFHSFSKALDEFVQVAPSFRQVGFNAAILGNFNSQAAKLSENWFYWQENALHHRMWSDVVSAAYTKRTTNKYIPSITQKRLNDSSLIETNSSDPVVHSLQSFASCPVRIAYVNVIQDFASPVVKLKDDFTRPALRFRQTSRPKANSRSRSKTGARAPRLVSERRSRSEFEV